MLCLQSPRNVSAPSEPPAFRNAMPPQSCAQETAATSEPQEWSQNPDSPIAEFEVDCEALSSSSSKPGVPRTRSKRGRLANTSASMLGCMRAGLRHVKRFHPSKKGSTQASSADAVCDWPVRTSCEIVREQSDESDVPEVGIEVLSVSQAHPAEGTENRAPRTFSTGSTTDLASIALEMPLPEALGLPVRGKQSGCPGAKSPVAQVVPRRERMPSELVKPSEGSGPGPVHTSLGQSKPHRTPVLEGASAGRCAAAALAPKCVPRQLSLEAGGTDVALSVYVLAGASVLNKVTELAGIGGAYHVGVEIFCLEWSFGWSPHGSGVHNVYAGCSEAGAFKERVVLGQTPCSPHEVIAILDELREAWPGNSYNLIRRNCAHFCMELVRLLKVREFPEWVNSLAALIDWLTNWVDDSREGKQALEGESAARQMMTALESTPRDTGDEDAAKQVLASELDWTEAQTYMLERAADAVQARKQKTQKNSKRHWM